jgi:hypothetical protein
MPWPVALAPINEAISCENHAKNLDIGGKKYRHNLGGNVSCKEILLSISIMFGEISRKLCMVNIYIITI